MIKISHEVPLDLLDNSPTFNDYDYCLPSYYLKYEKYKQYYLNAREKGRFIILDNGLFEGDAFTEDQLLQMIKEIKPNIFVVPDTWNDCDETIKQAERWEQYKPILPDITNLMIVLQGKTIEELHKVFIKCRLHYNHFGLNHSSIAYDDLYPHSNALISKMMGRLLLFNTLITTDPNNYYHFLGCSLPQELYLMDSHSKQYLSSVDTSNPIIWGALGEKYPEEGFLIKPKEKIEEFMEKDLSFEYKNIIFNINKFKRFVYA